MLIYITNNTIRNDKGQYEEVYRYNGNNLKNYTCKNFLGYVHVDDLKRLENIRGFHFNSKGIVDAITE